MGRYASAAAACLIVLGMANTGAAQVPEAPVSYSLEFYAVGTNPQSGQPVQTTNYQATAVSCGVTPKATAPQSAPTNPNTVAFDDPSNTEADCRIALNQSTTIFSIPVGSYVAYLQARGATLVSARSAASNPFNRQVVPVAPVTPTGLRVIGL